MAWREALQTDINGIATPKMQAFSGTPTYALEIAKQKKQCAFIKVEVHCIFIRNRDFYCIFKGFEEKLRLPYSCKATLVFLQNYPHFSRSDTVCADGVFS